MLRKHTHICLCVILICIPWFQSGCDIMLILLFPLSNVDRRKLISCFICLSTLKSFFSPKIKRLVSENTKMWDSLKWTSWSQSRVWWGNGGRQEASILAQGSQQKEWVDLPARFCPVVFPRSFSVASRRQALPLGTLLCHSHPPSCPPHLGSTLGPQRASGLLGNGKWLLLNCSRLWCPTHFL